MSHDQDFKHNLFFSHSKVHQYLEKFPNVTLANLGILNCYFFIAVLAFMSHDQDFKHNLFFPIQKCINT